MHSSRGRVFTARSGFCFWRFGLVAGCGVVRAGGGALGGGGGGAVGERWGAGWCDGGGRVVVEAALFGCVEDQLLGGVVDAGGALQEAGAGDAEAVQDVLGRAGEFAGLEGEGRSE